MCTTGFPVAPEGFNAVLGQLARWFYPFGSGAHCNNFYSSQCIQRDVPVGQGRRRQEKVTWPTLRFRGASVRLHYFFLDWAEQGGLTASLHLVMTGGEGGPGRVGGCSHDRPVPVHGNQREKGAISAPEGGKPFSPEVPGERASCAT